MTAICIVHHSGYGHTARQAAAVAEGVRRVDGATCHEFEVDALTDPEAPAWAELDAADAIVLGCPTYMGTVSADFKRFMEASSGRWMEQKWLDKLAAGFTNSGSWNGDKQNTLVALATFAAQHGMVWLNLGQMPGFNASGGSIEDRNRLGASLGAMAQSDVDVGPDVAPPEADLLSARDLGERVARSAARWAS